MEPAKQRSWEIGFQAEENHMYKESGTSLSKKLQEWQSSWSGVREAERGGR